MTIDCLNSYPLPDLEAVDKALAAELARDGHKLVVLDDDPTGVQTVHGVSVYTDWSENAVRQGFAESGKVFYILTNSRGMTAQESAAAHREIGAVVAKAAEEANKPYLILSRSDSTLRGHYPLEPQLLRESMEAAGLHVDGEVLCPFFQEGGRYTIGNVHYVRQGTELTPAAETEFAQDKTFGYTHSSIPDYIEEKTGGAYRADAVTCISLEELRGCDYAGIARKLAAVDGFNKVCVNAIDYCDLKVFATALYRVMAQGKRFMFRTAAGLVKVMGGIPDRPLLKRSDMVVRPTSMGGMVVVGSHTQKTTAQLEELLKLDCVTPIAFHSELLLEGDGPFYAEVDRCAAQAEQVIRSGRTAVCYSGRTVLSLPGDTKESALLRSLKISDGIQSIVARLGTTPAFVLAKGGITSSDVGIKALRVRRASVLGQIQPGIPVWQTGEESRFPSTPYVIFPGNTGGTDTLRVCVEILSGIGVG